MAAALLEEFAGDDVRAREESWRYSRNALRALEQKEFVAADISAEVAAPVRTRFEWKETNGCRLVFVNGAFAASLSDASGLLAGVAFTRGTDDRSLLQFSAEAEVTLHLVYVDVPSANPSRWRACLEIDVQAGKAHVIEQYLGSEGADVLGSLKSSVRIGADATLRLTTFVDLADSSSLYRHAQVSLEAAAAFSTTHVIFGGRLQRHELEVELIGVQSRFESHGVFVLGGRQHSDVHLDVRHVARDTACDLTWRGVADERARGVFHGAITVAPGADGSDARLSNKNLLLSAQAEIDTQPVLEIHADEVKAAHGATVGQLDERALFYLRSRGLPVDAARRLLVGAFCRAMLADIPQYLLERVEARLDSSLPPVDSIAP